MQRKPWTTKLGVLLLNTWFCIFQCAFSDLCTGLKVETVLAVSTDIPTYMFSTIIAACDFLCNFFITGKPVGYCCAGIVPHSCYNLYLILFHLWYKTQVLFITASYGANRTQKFCISWSWTRHSECLCQINRREILCQLLLLIRASVITHSYTRFSSSNSW